MYSANGRVIWLPCSCGSEKFSFSSENRHPARRHRGRLANPVPPAQENALKHPTASMDITGRRVSVACSMADEDEEGGR